MQTEDHYKADFDSPYNGHTYFRTMTAKHFGSDFGSKDFVVAVMEHFSDVKDQPDQDSLEKFHLWVLKVSLNPLFCRITIPIPIHTIRTVHSPSQFHVEKMSLIITCTKCCVFVYM